MATVNVVIRETGRALQDFTNVADIGRVVGRKPGSDGIQFITDPNSARLALGVLETNAPSLGFVSYVILGVAKVHAAAACSEGYLLTVGTSGGLQPILNLSSQYYVFGQMRGPLGAGQPGNVSSDAMGTAFVDFLNPSTNPISSGAATVTNAV